MEREQMTEPAVWIVAGSPYVVDTTAAPEADAPGEVLVSRVTGRVRHLNDRGGPLCSTGIKRPLFGYADDPTALGRDLPICTPCQLVALRWAAGWGIQ